MPRLGVSYDLTGQGQDRDQGQHRRLRAVAGDRLCHDLQPEGVRRRSTDVDRLEPRRHRAGERDRAHEQPQLRRPPQPESRSGYQPTLSARWGHRRSSTSCSRGLGLSVGYDHRRLVNNIWTRNLVDRPGQRLHARVGARSARQRPERCRSTTSRRASSAWSTSFDTNSSVNKTAVPGRRRHGERAVARRDVLWAEHRPAGRCRSPATSRDPNNLRFCDQTEYRCSAPDAIQAVWQRQPAVRRSPGSEFPEPARDRTHRHLCGRTVRSCRH